MSPLRDTRLVQASVPHTATFLEAARAFFGTGLSAIAVLDTERRVVGLFTDDDLLRGVFPSYLGELHHTAFVREEPGALAARIEQASGEPVERYMREPITVDIGASALHVAERFLHSPWGALAVVENERFLGMVDEVDFAETVMRQLGVERADGSSPSEER
ncbi:MAG TPA: CBS domain-containing protein [Gaiellaceae bacterium]|jgi:CBS domain-containing protein|nr:CBS domain-containing protein [Gaiellaceae bacterium]